MFHNKLKSDKLWVAYLALPKENPLCFVPTLYYATCFGSQKGPSLKQINNHEAQYNGHLTHALSISYYSLTLDGKLSVNMDFRWKKSRYQWKDIVCLCECITFIVHFFLSLLHQLHLRSSGIRSWRLGTPGLRDKTLDFHFYCFSCSHNPPLIMGPFES